MADKIQLAYEDYEPSDSEDDLDPEERELIANVRKKREVDDPKREILRFDESEDDEDEDDDDDVKNLVADSDIEEGDDYDGIPDEKAWGKKRSAFYHTDFVDQDYSTYTEKEEELAQQEEEEAKAIQQRLAQQLDEADFTLDIYNIADDSQSTVGDLDTSKTKLKKDLSQLTARQKQQLFQKDSPEFAGLVQDFEKYTTESDSILGPILKYAEENDVQLPIIEFIQTRHNLILTYCTNISFYLVLKSKRVSVKSHPVVKRLVQLRQLIIQLEDTFENVVKPQLEGILEALSSGQEFIIRSVSHQQEPVERKKKLPKKKRLGVLKSTASVEREEESDDSDYDSQDISADKELMDTSDEEMENAEKGEEGEDEENGEDDDERRGITYQIAKNKGLTPSRKKENRNPRVKHRNKFRKALIRRKGAVRTVRKEVTRYGGEMSGIKANVRKGIKFKS